MFKWLWFCPFFLFAGCTAETPPNEQWQGTYIGYYHHNQKDTTTVTLVFEGKYFAVSPCEKQQQESTGIFQDDRSALIFQNTTDASSLAINGAFQYRFGADGSVRIWQQNNDGMNEMILRHK